VLTTSILPDNHLLSNEETARYPTGYQQHNAYANVLALAGYDVTQEGLQAGHGHPGMVVLLGVPQNDQATRDALASVFRRVTEVLLMAPPRLSQSTLHGVELPSIPYDRQQLTPGIVHLGVGAFHRAHQAVFLHKTLAKMSADVSRWGIVGVSLRSSAVRDQLSAQDGLYTVHERQSERTDVSLIGCLLRCLVAPEGPQEVLELLASTSVRIVSLTVTEKGYCYEPSTRSLNLHHVDIQHDLENTEKPRSALGFLVLALRLRWQRGFDPFTVLPCDNLPDNGQTVRGLSCSFADALGCQDFSNWMRESVWFAGTMVDCIVPATKERDVDLAAADLCGLRDEAMVVCEPFRQWVIQDNFGVLGRPPLEVAGVQFVQDVRPFEEAKLCILNGVHSMLAYTGFLGGMEYIWQVMACPQYASLATLLLERDVLPVLESPSNVDLQDYARTTLCRLQNRALEHRTVQIAMDGSQKLPQRLLKTARRRMQRTSDTLHVIPFVVAAWMRYVTRLDPQGVALRVEDPFAERFAQIAESASGPRDVAARLLGIHEIFGDGTFVGNPVFSEPLIGHLRDFMGAPSGPAVCALVTRFVEKLITTS